MERKLSVEAEIEKAKKKLKKQKLCENFGQNEVSKLRDKYFGDYLSLKKIDAFDEWCMTYDGDK